MSNNQTLPLTNASLLEQLQWLQANAVSDGVYNITITADESIGMQTLSFPDKSNIVLRLVTDDGAGEKVISLVGKGSLFTIDAGVTLILEEGVTLCGHAENTDPLVLIKGGCLIMNDGAEIKNNASTGFYGGGVRVDPKGVFTMTGGKIFGNSAAGNGGGVVVEWSAKFTITGGQIFGNTAGLAGGGVAIESSGKFIMKGGEIFDNTSIGNGNGNGGGGVVVWNGEFSMVGGKIHGNKAGELGGGVSVIKRGVFTMTGGEITNNSTDGTGGGVNVMSGEFKKDGGQISGNHASRRDNEVHENWMGLPM